MKIKQLCRIWSVALGALALLSTINHPLSSFAQGTAFTYQGRLSDTINPVTGIYDLRFAIYDSLSGGALVAGPVTNSPVPITNGLFTVTLDFGAGVFNGADRWLDIGARTNGPGPFSPLSPRQKLTPTPYAITAGNLVGGGLSGTYSNAVTFNNLANSFSGNGGGLTNINAVTLGGLSVSNFWKTGGNAGTTPGVNFLGTTDNQPLAVKVNNATALQFMPGNTLPNVVGGLAAFRPSVIAPGVSGAVIAGGNAPSGGVNGFGGGDFQAVYDNDGAIGGGFGNKVGNGNADVTDAAFATIAGGVFNSAANYAATVAGGDGNYSAGSRSFIGGGYGNVTSGDFTVLGGGLQNVIQPGVPYSTIAGGQANVVQSNSPSATISGGQNNSISPGGLGYVSAKGATIGGGVGNTVFGSGGFPEGPLFNEYGTIGGGYSNTVNGSYGTVPGGYLNTASGDFSFAAGSRAAAGYGCFVWADASSTSPFFSTAINQFCIRAAGGVRLNTDTSLLFGNTGASKLSPDQGGAIELGNSTSVGVAPYIDFHYGFGSAQDYNVRIVNDGTETLSILRFGSGTRMAQFSPAGLSVNGTFVSTSDRNLKENFEHVDSRAVLEKVAALPVSSWNYKSDQTSRHLGPMAQDFFAAFGVGPDDKHITTVDESGVALAAIQGLNEKVQEKEAEIQSLKEQNDSLEQRLNRMEAMLKQLTSQR